MTMTRFAACLAIAASMTTTTAACTAFETNLQDTEVDLKETAKQNFDDGEAAFTGGQYAEAVKFFEHTKNKFPYSKYAVLAELRIADAHFAREKWIEAADAYKIFVRFHPRHERVAYATFRVALAYSNEIDQDVWFLPTAIEKDQSAAKDAIRSFDEFIARFPDDENIAEARKLRIAARARLAEGDLYAAQFYSDRQRWRGALWRYERVATDFGDTPKAPFALLRAAQIADEKLNEPAEAERLYQQLVREHPASDEAKAAKQALDARKPAPGPTTTPPPPAAPTAG